MQLRAKKEYHFYIYIFGLLVLAASLTLSTLLMSLAGFLLLFNWIAEGDFKRKWNTLKEQKAILIFLLIYFVHLAGLCYTHNFSFAFDDLRIKLPLLELPVIFGTTKSINRKTLINILLVHVAATLVASFISVIVFYSYEINDMREISVFISHIRFSLNIVLDIFILFILLFTSDSFRWPFKFVFGLLIVWFIYFLLFMESFTGIILLAIVSVILILIYILQKTPLRFKLLFFALLIVAGSGIFFYLRNIYVEYQNSIETFNPVKLEYYTRHGGNYAHDLNSKLTDNGYYTWRYVCDEELENSWNSRSKIRFDSTDKLNQPIRYTLIRFLTSKGLRKDMDAVNCLTDKEISLIENGVANVEYTRMGSFKNRLKNTLWEYENYKISGDPRGQSMMQRIELWRCSVNLIKDYPLLGAGTGDAADAFVSSLYLQNSILKNADLRSHNQFLTFAIAFGILGFIIILFALIYPPVKLHLFSDFLFLSFFLIAILSMLTEDTLETQAGVTFFAFFYCLYVFAFKRVVAE
jgi:hypothetical protein